MEDALHGQSPEGIPSLRVEKINANSVGDAIFKTKTMGAPAGSKTFDWIEAKSIAHSDARNAHNKEVAKALKGNGKFILPGMQDGAFVMCVSMYEGVSDFAWRRLSDGWNADDHLVFEG
jgi:hypothetical protein